MDSKNSTSKSWLQKKGFSEWSVALFWIFAAFLLFQLVGGLIAAILFISSSGSIPAADEIMSQAGRYLNQIFIGNSVGQILFLGVGTWLITGIHLRNRTRSAFLRLNYSSSAGQQTLLAAGLIIAIQPLIWVLSWLNAQLPVPESVFRLEQMQTELITQYLSGDHSLALTLLHVSLVPAICEEVMFRGYLLRAFQNRWGIKIAILASSLVFGFFHLRFTQVLPLVIIGAVLAYVTWTSESIIPAMLAHLINNGGSVIAVYAFPESNFADMSPSTLPPLHFVLISLVLSGYLLYLLHTYQSKHN